MHTDAYSRNICAQLQYACPTRVTSNPTSFAQKGAVVAFNLPSESVEEMRVEFEARLVERPGNAVFGEVTNPNYVALDGDGNVLGKQGGKVSPGVFSSFLKGALERHKGAGKVTQASSGG